MGRQIKAIETRYKGYRFRSRLEARWAVFFDTIGWDWRYEHQGYVIGWDENDTLAWLPDFEIVTPIGQHFYVEVKGDPNFFADERWLDRLDFNGGPPGFPDCGWAEDFDENAKPLLVLGDVPFCPKDPVDIAFPIVMHYKGVCHAWVVLRQKGLCYEARDQMVLEYGLKDFQPKVYPASEYDEPDTDATHAISVARCARFEHGESGA